MEITIDDITFRILNKFNQNDSRWFIELESYLAGTGDPLAQFTVYRSNSECGVCRLCLTSERFELEKGIDYTLTTLICLELQLFISENFHRIPETTYSVFNGEGVPITDGQNPPSMTLINAKEVCRTDFSTINSIHRMILLDEESVIYNPETIIGIGPYNYNTGFNNHMVFPNSEYDRYVRLKTIDERRQFISSQGPPYTSDTSISFGDTSINIEGLVYSIEFTASGSGTNNTPQPFVLYYMVCNVNITVNRSIAIPFDLTDIDQQNVVIPMMISPKQKILFDQSQPHLLKKYGLYDTYCTFQKYIMGKSLKTHLKFSKLLEYIQHCDSLERCTSIYAYNGREYGRDGRFPFMIKLQDILFGPSAPSSNSHQSTLIDADGYPTAEYLAFLDKVLSTHDHSTFIDEVLSRHVAHSDFINQYLLQEAEKERQRVSGPAGGSKTKRKTRKNKRKKLVKNRTKSYNSKKRNSKKRKFF